MEYLHKKDESQRTCLSLRMLRETITGIPYCVAATIAVGQLKYIPISGETLADSKNSYEICYIVAQNHSNGSQPAAAANSATCLFIIQVLRVQPAEIWTAKLEFISIQNLYIESYLLK